MRSSNLFSTCLLIFSCLATQIWSTVNAQSLQWGAGINGPGVLEVRETEITDGGSVYSTGHFTSIVDFDPGAGVLNLDAGNGFNGWVQKLNPNGGMSWTVQVGDTTGNNETVVMYGLTVTDSGYVYASGHYYGSVDFDPGPGTHYLNASVYEMFVLKLDSNGQFLWVYSTEGVGQGASTSSWSIDADGFGNVYALGHTYDSVDVDPGPGTVILDQTDPDRNTIVVKLDPAGNLIWGRSFGNGDDTQGFGIACDPQGNAYVGGGYLNTIDIDPGPGTQSMTSSGGQDIFILKLDVNGNLAWGHSIGSPSGDWILSLDVNSMGDVVACGSYTGTVDFDPGVGVANLVSQSSFNSPLNGFVLKLDAGGNYSWARSLDASLIGHCDDLSIGGADNIYVCGDARDTVDLDPGPGQDLIFTGLMDVYFMVLDDNGIYVNGHGFEAPVGVSEFSWTISANANEEFVIGGKFDQGMDLDPGPGVDSLPSGPGTNMFIVNLSLDSCATLLLAMDSILTPT